MSASTPVAWPARIARFARSPSAARALAAVAFGVGLALGSPPFDVYPALWLGMAGLAWLLAADPRWPAFASPARVALTGARRGLAFGFGANIVALRFIPAVVARFTPLPWAAGALGLVLLATFEGLRWMTAAVACETLARARVPRPIAFAGGVYAGTFVPTMLAWTPAGGVTPWPAMVQLADVVGERGVAAMMALAAGLAAAGVRAAAEPGERRRAGLLVGCAAALVAAQACYGAARMRAVDRASAGAERVRVALVQPSVGATTRWEDGRAPSLVAHLAGLTARADARGADLVVWPEGAYPYRLPHGVRRIPDGDPAVVPPGVRATVLTGLMMSGAADGAAFNSAIVATPGGALSESYDKRRLLWFGETVPLADRLPWLRQVFARGLGLAAGDRPVVFRVGRARIAVLICYEDTLPEAGRDAMEPGPNLLVNVTNDAWFSGSSESELHLRLAVLRAVELRRDLVRAVNYGPTSWIDAAGRVLARTPGDFATIAATEPALREAPPTFFARFGDAPWALLALALANAAVWRAAAQMREGRRAA